MSINNLLQDDMDDLTNRVRNWKSLTKKMEAKASYQTFEFFVNRTDVIWKKRDTESTYVMSMIGSHDTILSVVYYKSTGTLLNFHCNENS